VFQGVRRADPGTAIRASDGALLHAGSELRWTSRPANSEALVELTIESVRRSVERTVHLGRPLVALSGGRDSRLIYLALRALGIRPRLILTAGRGSESPDALVASNLAHACGDPIEHVSGVRFDPSIERWRHARQNFESLEHSWFLGVAMRARALGGSVTDGIGAGVLSTGSLMHPVAVELWRRRALDELADWTMSHAAGTTPRFRAAVRSLGVPLATDDEVRDALVQTLRELECYPNPLGTFSLLNWTRRGISASAFGLLSPERVLAPLYDEQLVRALLAIELQDAIREDWRELVVRRLDRSGLPFAESLESRRRRRVGSVRGWWRWRCYEQDCGPAWSPLFDAIRAEQGGVRRSFSRAAILALRTMLEALAR
jgi:hypothetical protein